SILPCKGGNSSDGASAQLLAIDRCIGHNKAHIFCAISANRPAAMNEPSRPRSRDDSRTVPPGDNNATGAYVSPARATRTIRPHEALAPAPGGPGLPAGYELLRELGGGGMGVVYQARDTKLNRLVALKMILAGSHAAPSEMQRFLKEAEAVAAFQ